MRKKENLIIGCLVLLIVLMALNILWSLDLISLGIGIVLGFYIGKYKFKGIGDEYDIESF